MTKQAGIYAGTGGYDITANGTTTLTGAVIASKADKETNRLTTGNLIMKDIQNEASYSASSDGFNLSTDKGTAVNPLGLGKVTSIPVNGEATSITRSAIAEGLILVADKRSEKEINHNTQEAMQTLGKIFDKKSVEEKQALVNQMAQEGYKLIGDVAAQKAWDYTRKAEQAEREGNRKQAQAYLEEAKKWGEGGTYKLALHGGFGAVLGVASGNGALGSAMAATTNEAAQNVLHKISDGEVHKLVSEVLGTVVSGASGGAIAHKATEFNWLTHDDQMALLKDYISFKNGYMSEEEFVRKLAWYNRLMWYEKENNYIYHTNNETSKELLYALYYGNETLKQGSETAFSDVMNELIYNYVTVKGYGDLFAAAEEEMSSKIVQSRKGYIDGSYGSFRSYEEKRLIEDGAMPTGLTKKEQLDYGYIGVMNMRAGYPVKYTGSYYVADGSYVREEDISEVIKRLARGEVVNSDDIEITYKDGEYYASQRGSLIKASISEAQALAIQGNSAYEKENDRLKNLPANTSVGMGVNAGVLSVERTSNKSEDGKIYETYEGEIGVGYSFLKDERDNSNSIYRNLYIKRVNADYIDSSKTGEFKGNIEGTLNLGGNGYSIKIFDDSGEVFPDGNYIWGFSPNVEVSGGGSLSYTKELKSPMDLETLNLVNSSYPIFNSSYGKLVLAEIKFNSRFNWRDVYINKNSRTPVIIVTKDGHYQIFDVVVQRYYPISEDTVRKYYERLVV